MKLGVIADDFTGASDIALTIAEAGMSVAQFIGVPNAAPPGDLDAGVVALKSRTTPLANAISDSLAACDWLTDQGVEQIILKVCSTFDSTKEGNIGPVLEALAERLGETRVLVCPAFPENGRSVYQGHLFVADRLLNESGMQNHPLTPMWDADLRRVLVSQTSWDVGHIPVSTILAGAQAVVAALEGPPQMLIADAIRDDDLLTLGKAIAGRKLLCGGSGIALGLPANFGAAAAPPGWTPIRGAGVVLSGSCSRATLEQVERYRAIAPSRAITAEDAVGGALDVAEVADWVMAQDAPPLVYSSADPNSIKTAQGAFGRETAAGAIERLFAALARELVARGLCRVVVAGGETSGAVVAALDVDILQIGPRIAAGVPLVRIDRDRPLAIALKSGNFGGPDFFAEAFDMMEGA